MRFLCLFLAAGLLPAATAPARPARSIATPSWFEPGREAGRYVSRQTWGALAVDPRGAEVRFAASAFRLELEGARERAVEPLDRRPAVTNYFSGARAAWRGGVPQFSRVRQAQVLPGIDTVYYATGRQLEYDFIVAPGADPGRIRLRFRGARNLRLSAAGELVFRAGAAEVRQPRPFVYQQAGERRETVAAAYRLAADGSVRFALGAYDRSRPLIIDPVLAWSGFAGGGLTDYITASATAPDGSLWVTGATASPRVLPDTFQPYQPVKNGNRDAFVAQYKPDESGALTLAHFTYLGGGADDEGRAILADAQGTIWVAGYTNSSDFPKLNSLMDAKGGAEAFLVRLDPSKNGTDALLAGTLYGGDKFDTAEALAMDASGAVYLAGYSDSGALPGVDGTVMQPANRGGYDGFVVKLDVGGDSKLAIAVATFLGGYGSDIVTGLAVDGQRRVYLTGFTSSDNFPTTEASYSEYASGRGDAFLTRIDFSRAGLGALDYSTLLGGSDLDAAQALALDAQGRVWLAGYTLSADFPVGAGALQRANAGGADLFLACLDPAQRRQAALVGSTYFGGAGGEVPYALLLRGAALVVAGYTYSNDYPLKSPPAGQTPGRTVAEGFLTVFDVAPDATLNVAWSTRVGGRGQDVLTTAACDAAGTLYAAGYTTSLDFPVTGDAAKPSPAGLLSGVILRITP